MRCGISHTHHAYALVPQKRIEIKCLELGYIDNAAGRRVDMHKVCPPKCSNSAQWYWFHCSGPQVSSTNFNSLCSLCMESFHVEFCARFSTRNPWVWRYDTSNALEWHRSPEIFASIYGPWGSFKCCVAQGCSFEVLYFCFVVHQTTHTNHASAMPPKSLHVYSVAESLSA